MGAPQSRKSKAASTQLPVHLISRHEALQLELGVTCHRRREGHVLV